MEPRPRVHGVVRFFVGCGIATLVLAALATLFVRMPTFGPKERTEFLLEEILDACRQYKLERGSFPAIDEDGGTRALVSALTRPSGAGGAGVPFLGVTERELDGAATPQFVDGWDRPLRYRLNGSKVELISAGTDGRFGTSDDFVLTK